MFLPVDTLIVSEIWDGKAEVRQGANLNRGEGGLRSYLAVVVS